MNRLIKSFILLLFINSLIYASTISNKNILKQNEFENTTVRLDIGSNKILEFEKKIKSIQFSNSNVITGKFIDSKNPLTTIKITARNIGNENAIVTFVDSSTLSINFSVLNKLDEIITIIQSIYPDIKIKQINNSIVLQGKVRNSSDKNKIISVLEKSGIDVKSNLIDLIEDQNSTKMVRVKLYVVEINNNKGTQFLTDWVGSYTSGNFSTVNTNNTDNHTLSGNTLYNNGLLTNNLNNATSLTGGLTTLATYLGSNFNVGLTLNFLKQNNAVRVLNESTLMLQENKKGMFSSGGKIKVNTSTTSAEGQPITEIIDIDYGLNLEIFVNKIIDNKFVDFSVIAKSDTIDNNIDVINTAIVVVALNGNSVTTNLVINDKATAILGGVLKVDKSNAEERIPLLGDIPVLGKLFTNSVDNNYSSDLAFFITPEIVDPRELRENDILENKVNIIKNDASEDGNNEENIELKKEDSKESQNKEIIEEKKLSDKEVHKKRVNEILGY